MLYHILLVVLFIVTVTEQITGPDRPTTGTTLLFVHACHACTNNNICMAMISLPLQFILDFDLNQLIIVINFILMKL